MERRISSTNEVRIERRADGAPLIVGYGAVFYDGSAGTEYELWGGVKERVMATAFDRAIREKQDVRGLFNHDNNVVLGRTKSGTMKLSKDARGLRYEITPPETEQARTVISAIERGDISGSSFSFRAQQVVWRDLGDFEVRELADVDLFDTGPVTFPAYQGTDVSIRAAASIADVRKSYETWKAQHADIDKVRARLAQLG